MTKKELKAFIKSDAYRYGAASFINILKLYFKTPGFNYTVKMRLAAYFSQGGIRRIIFPLSYFIYRRAMIKYGISIPYKTKIGYGFYIGHFGGIVVNSNAIIGNNVNISQGVTIGQGGKDGDKGSPVIQDNVYIGANATVVGKIIVGNNSAIGANAFVNKDVPDFVAVGGVPAKVISQTGSKDYIHNVWKTEAKQ